MRIQNVRAFTVNIPLEKPIFLGGYRVSAREYALVEIESDTGAKGYGFTFTRGGDVSAAVAKHLKPLLLGENPLMTEKIWQSMYRNTRYNGKKGLLMRAVSAVDIALWDLKGKACGMPVYRMLGGYRDEVPAILACGYYLSGKTVRDLADEVKFWAERGFKLIKIMAGGAAFREDVERIRAARRALGDDVPLAIDVNGVWTSVKDALDFARAVEDCRLSFIEEPFQPEQLPALKAFAERADRKVAIGEAESGRWAFRDLLSGQAVDILRPDATLAGGISEWMKVAHLASAWDIPLLPHYFPYVHIHLAAAAGNAEYVEFVTTEYGISNFETIVRNRLPIADGIVKVPQDPGLGIELDWERVERFTTEVFQ